MARYYSNGSNKKRTDRENERQKEINQSITQPVSDLGETFVDGSGSWFDFYTGKQNYSDHVSRMNELTDGWYSTIYGAVPFVNNIHNALLQRDSAKDYMDNNGLTWKDIQGYNASKLTGGVSSNLSSLINQGTSWLSNISSDLGKLYSGQK